VTVFWVYVQIIIIGFLGSFDDGRALAISGPGLADSAGVEYVCSTSVGSDYIEKDDEARSVYRLFLRREYRRAFYELSETHSSGRDCLLFALSFFTQYLILPFLAVAGFFFLTANRRLSPIFCNTSEKEEIWGILKPMMIVCLANATLIHFAFNPLSGNYIEKVCVSVFLHNKPVGASLRNYFSSGISLFVIPIYYMS